MNEQAPVPRAVADGVAVAGRVVIVGAGVSGCACGASLAAAGVGVTLVGACLDRVGEPSYGPLVLPAADGGSIGAEVLELLPDCLRNAWRWSASVSDDGMWLVVDRRHVSVETKRALELMPGLEFRQGVVDDVRLMEGPVVGPAKGGARSLSVRSAFGEVFEADAVVIAVGAGLGAAASGGPPGGRDGRAGGSQSERVAAALERLGARFTLLRAEVGACYGGGGACLEERWEHEQSVRLRSPASEPEGMLVPVTLRRLERECRGRRESIEGPESPYDMERLWPHSGLAARSEQGASVPVLVPDGLATGEWALRQGRDDELGLGAGGQRVELCREMVMSRQGFGVEGLAVINIDRSGRLGLPGGCSGGVWITGRAAGSSGYLESLRAGVRTAQAVGRFLESVDERSQ